MKSLSFIFGLLPTLLAPQGPSVVTTIRGKAVAVQAMQFRMNDAIPSEILVRVSGGPDSPGEIVRIQCSIPAGAYENWLKNLPSLHEFSVRPAAQGEFILNETMIITEPKSNGENVASQIKAWKPINGFNLNSLPFGKSIKSFQSSQCVQPIV